MYLEQTQDQILNYSGKYLLLRLFGRSQELVDYHLIDIVQQCRAEFGHSFNFKPLKYGKQAILRHLSRILL